MEYLFSVDAGGSKTLALLTTSELELISVTKSGPMNVLENGEKVVRKNLKRLTKMFERVPKGSVVRSCFGMPALGEFQNSESYLKKIIVEEIGLEPQLVVNDVVMGWAAGTVGKDGVHVVAGTGTMAYGRRGSQECRSGGWGSLIGDEGSAYDIGRETLRRVCRQIDGREPETLLKDFVMGKLRFQNWWELSNWVYSKPFPDRRPAIAAVAQLTHEAARLGDGVALEILKNAGREIALCVLAVVRRLNLQAPLVSYGGSVLVENQFVREEFQKFLVETVPNVRVQKAAFQPVVGGLVLLLKKSKMDIDEPLMNKLKLISDQCQKVEKGAVLSGEA
ncbi:N-acetylglucosamine kinase [Pseudothermotoga sp.]